MDCNASNLCCFRWEGSRNTSAVYYKARKIPQKRFVICQWTPEKNNFEQTAYLMKQESSLTLSWWKILFGNAFLNNDTITNYQATLASIGQSLTTSGDILFYGCNVASTEQGEILIKRQHKRWNSN